MLVVLLVETCKIVQYSTWVHGQRNRITEKKNWPIKTEFKNVYNANDQSCHQLSVYRTCTFLLESKGRRLLAAANNIVTC